MSCKSRISINGIYKTLKEISNYIFSLSLKYRDENILKFKYVIENKILGNKAFKFQNYVHQNSLSRDHCRLHINAIKQERFLSK